MKHLQADHILGVVKLDGRWRLFSGHLGDWVMDYPAYDPGWQRPSSHGFRGGLWRIDEANASQFCEYMQPEEFTTEEIRALVAEDGIESVPICVVIDFDARRFVNGVTGDALQNYVPAGWGAAVGEPFDYLPSDVQRQWFGN